jgi:hypothetical protein
MDSADRNVMRACPANLPVLASFRTRDIAAIGRMTSNNTVFMVPHLGRTGMRASCQTRAPAAHLYVVNRTTGTKSSTAQRVLHVLFSVYG